MPGPPAKEPLLDLMVEHVMYEYHQTLLFLEQGNRWALVMLPTPLANLAHNGTLEAALVHLRCLVEFLEGSKPNRANARDYVKGWRWSPNADLRDGVRALHSRVAHLGLERVGPDFDWRPWLDRHAPAVLAQMREFFVCLRAQDPDRYARYVRPTPDHQTVPRRVVGFQA
ncbi:MAG: hypothetical protein RL238_2255 [Actinomycetota bacterium]|jgi:hypothetical protein